MPSAPEQHGRLHPAAALAQRRLQVAVHSRAVARRVVVAVDVALRPVEDNDVDSPQRVRIERPPIGRALERRMTRSRTWRTNGRGRCLCYRRKTHGAAACRGIIKREPLARESQDQGNRGVVSHHRRLHKICEMRVPRFGMVATRNGVTRRVAIHLNRVRLRQRPPKRRFPDCRKTQRLREVYDLSDRIRGRSSDESGAQGTKPHPASAGIQITSSRATIAAGELAVMMFPLATLKQSNSRFTVSRNRTSASQYSESSGPPPA